MTAPEPPPEDGVEVETAAPEPADEGAMLALILAAIAAYLAAKQVVKGPWRQTALTLGLAKVAGNGLGLLAQRGLTRQAKATPRTISVELLAQHKPAQQAAVAAGIEHLVRTIYGVQDRMLSDAAAARAQPPDPTPGGTPRTQGDGAAAATSDAPGGTTTARRAPAAGPGAGTPPEPGTADAARLSPRDLLSTAQLGNIARDLADVVLQTATATAAALTRNWEKTWVSRGDERVRDSHRELAGVTIPVLDSFTTPGGPIRYPHDPKAPAGEVINCRCSLRFTYRRKAQRVAASALVPPDRRRYRVARGPDPADAPHLVRVGAGG